MDDNIWAQVLKHLNAGEEAAGLPPHTDEKAAEIRKRLEAHDVFVAQNGVEAWIVRERLASLESRVKALEFAVETNAKINGNLAHSLVELDKKVDRQNLVRDNNDVS